VTDDVATWCVCVAAVSGGPHEERLIADITRNRNYTALARPVAEESEAVFVSFGISLQQIIRVVSRQSSCRLYIVIRLHDVGPENPLMF